VRLLILGGTVFLGRALAVHARAAGHDVTCAARGVSGAPPDGVCFITIDRGFLESQGVRRWAGPRSIPLWVPLPEFGDLLTRDATVAHADGLRIRPLAETARATLAWAQAAGEVVTGLSAEEEAALLRAWHAR
jgi:nucleoside-diphosphate-sugar epimerase